MMMLVDLGTWRRIGRIEPGAGGWETRGSGRSAPSDKHGIDLPLRLGSPITSRHEQEERKRVGVTSGSDGDGG